jgi:molybdopterin converting factor small subunit
MAITVLTMGLVAVQMPGQLTIEPGPVSGLALRDLLFDHLAGYDPNLPEALVDAQGQLNPGYAILVDGRNAVQIGGLDLFVRDGATVLITAMVSGG